MSIYRTGNTYKAEIFIGSKRIKCKRGFKNKTLAKKWHDEEKLNLTKNPSSQTRRDIKFIKVIEKFIEDYMKTKIKQSTGIRYMTDIEKRIIPGFGNMMTDKITSLNIQNFQNSLIRSKKIEPASINRCLTVLHSIFEKGIIWDLCAQNPCKRIQCLKEVKKPYRWWKDKSVIFKFLNHAEGNNYYLFYRVALETGMRLGELTGLIWEAVNLETGQIEVYQQYNVSTGRYVPLKNNQYRTVWIPTPTLPLLHQQKLKSTSNHVFTKVNGSIVRNDSVSNTIFKKLQRDAGVPIINFHGLRHTYASHYMMNGGEIYDLSKLLGHSSIEVTMKYAHLSPESLKRNRDRVSFDNSNIEVLKKFTPNSRHPEKINASR